MKIRVKICCISDRGEANLAVEAGASALGLVGHMPSGPGVIPDVVIADIALAAPPAVGTFLLTSATTGTEIVQHVTTVRTNTVQIVDRISPGEYPYIRAQLPGLKIVQVVHVLDDRSVEEALEYASLADALLLDSGNPNLQVKELGGTGRIHDWAISRTIRERAGIPVFLAGGLTAQNVRAAIEAVQPFGVDLCSGVRTAGKLDKRKLEEFFSAIHA
ncbi:MAG: phosphoribosylanthranilate isomerase [Bacteroidetes bacterium]|nr:MAG: phosphoribosylanthranilate isomerase [Bacteroidota bacterium]